ncbi:pph-5 [Symbiodinium sp. CCMP2456]|nr:pph-5 [Symbiodinium sp. CCMP2456]
MALKRLRTADQLRKMRENFQAGGEATVCRGDFQEANDMCEERMADMEKEWCSTQQLLIKGSLGFCIYHHSRSILRGMLSARRCQKLSASEVSMPEGCMIRIQTPPEEEKKKEVLPQSIDIHTLKHVLEYAQECKREGNLKFQEGLYEEALYIYSQADDAMKKWKVAKHLKNEEKWLKDYHLACLKNKAQAALKLELFQTALEASDAALSIDTEDHKAWYRKVQAEKGLGRFKEAEESLAKLEDVAQWCPDRRRILRDCEAERKRIKVARVKHRQSTQEMLGRAFEAGVFSIDRDRELEEAAKKLEEPPAQMQVSTEQRKSLEAQARPLERKIQLTAALVRLLSSCQYGTYHGFRMEPAPTWNGENPDSEYRLSSAGRGGLTSDQTISGFVASKKAVFSELKRQGLDLLEMYLMFRGNDTGHPSGYNDEDDDDGPEYRYDPETGETYFLDKQDVFEDLLEMGEQGANERLKGKGKFKSKGSGYGHVKGKDQTPSMQANRALIHGAPAEETTDSIAKRNFVTHFLQPTWAVGKDQVEQIVWTIHVVCERESEREKCPSPAAT